MFGAVRKRDILAHPCVTIRSFGWSVFFKALIAGRNQTFLSLLAGSSVFRAPTVETPDLLRRCIELESRAGRIYESLAGRFTDREPVKQFFETLAHQEDEHYEMLELCRELARREGWLEECVAPWQDVVPRLEQQMDEVERSLGDLDCVTDALRLVIRLEDSEINQVFEGAVRATDSGFVRYLRPFQEAVEKHLWYICDRIAKIEPGLADQCGGLRADRLNEHVA